MRLKLKVGGQYLSSHPLLSKVVMIYGGCIEGYYEFTPYTGGRPIGSMSLLKGDIDKNTWNLTPIAKSHPAYVKNNAANKVMRTVMTGLRKASAIEKRGGSQDEMFEALLGGGL